MDTLLSYLEETVANIMERIKKLETQEAPPAWITFVHPSSMVVWNDNLEYTLPDAAITLENGTYIVQLILDRVSFGDPSGRLRATIQIDGVSQAPELVNNITQTWKIIIPYEETHTITVIVSRETGSGSISVSDLNTQLIVSRIGPPTA